MHGIYFGLSIVVVVLIKYDIIFYMEMELFFLLYLVVLVIVFFVFIYFKSLLRSKVLGSKILSVFLLQSYWCEHVSVSES